MLYNKFVLLVLVTLGLSISCLAQFKDYGYKIGLQGHYVIPANEFTEEKFNPSILIRPHAIFELSNLFDFGVGIGYGWMQGEDYGGAKYKTSFIPLDIRLFLSPVNSDVVNPYVYIGAGGAYWMLDTKPANVIPPPTDDSGIAGLAELGLGIEFALTPQWLIDITAGSALFTTDNINGLKSNKNDKFLHDYDRYSNIGLGITYVVGSCHTDEDKDGLEKCDEDLLKSDPKNADTDGDGLKDGEEYLTYKTNLLKADTDGDGLKDGQEVKDTKTDPNKMDTDGDGLNDGAEVNDYNTNPLKVDTDGDKLSDSEEVNTTKTDPNKADTDGDGLSDYEEINTTKTDPKIPDTDGDGLNDGAEVNTYKTNPLNKDTDAGSVPDGVEVNRGTNPLDKSDDVAKVVAVGQAWNLRGIRFASGKAEILPESHQTLDSAYQALKLNKDWLVEIQGHTDSDGSNKANQTLSEKRAQSVKDYLVSKGIDPSRIATKGFGELKPIASNKTKEGKAQNRRIEFVRTK